VNAPNPGLCDRCSHCRRTGAARGSVFHMCLLHERDPRFAKYPRLPVVHCPGYKEKLEDPTGG